MWRKCSRKKQDERSEDGDGGTCVEEKIQEEKKRKKNIWSVWMQGKKGKRIKNHNQMLPQYFNNISQ